MVSFKQLSLFGVFCFILGASSFLVFQQEKPTVANTVSLVLSPGADVEYLTQISSAKQNIDIMLYQFSYKPLKEALAKAVQRGVKVRIILESRIDVNLDTASELSSNGIKVRFATKDFANTHAKTMAIDGKKTIIGSTNWSQHAMKQNREVSVLIESQELVNEFMQVFEEDWVKAKEYLR